uniref:Reticulocyte-binding protein 2 a n=1 Tax=Anthurium amnicola TaxID=1678845 RepID=A0A1D1YGJ8_9ARAE
MGSPAAPQPPIHATNARCDLRLCRSRSAAAPFRPPNPFPGFPSWKQRRVVCLCSSPRERWPAGGAWNSWLHQRGSRDELGGWLVARLESEEKKFPRFLTVCVGTSVAVLLAALVHLSFFKKGSKLQLNMLFHAFHGLVTPVESGSSLRCEDDQISKKILDGKPVTTQDAFKPTTNNDMPASGEKKRIVPVAADSTQRQALFVLKKLKIIEDDVKPDELCTRREYARWLVKANSLLERNPKHKIVLSELTGRSTATAFDDVNVDDPDFWCIQALGEVGIAPCKLLAVKSNVSDDNGSVNHQKFNFEPDSFLSRLHLVDWRVQLEYLFGPAIEEKMLRKNLDFMDLDSIGSDASPALFMDILARDKSIARRVFGNSRRLQPHKPATKAQAAVALTSGRMAEAIQTEISRLEVENASRLVEMEDIHHEIICRGEIQRFWEEKLNTENIRGLETQNDYLAALNELNKEKMALDEDLADHIKERTALDCQKQLLICLKEEVRQLQGRLAKERVNLLTEQEIMEKECIELCNRQDVIAEAKSILEVEKEALRILRSWVEEEACKSQMRAKVLESAVQRWKWDEQSSVSQTSSPEN